MKTLVLIVLYKLQVLHVSLNPHSIAIFFFYEHFLDCFTCIYVWTQISAWCPWRLEGHEIPRNWSYGWLWAAVWVLEMEPVPSVRTSAVHCWAISPALQEIFRVGKVECCSLKTKHARQNWHSGRPSFPMPPKHWTLHIFVCFLKHSFSL